MAGRYGNWNARVSPHEAERREGERRKDCVLRITALVQTLYDVISQSDLSSEEKTTAIEMFNALYRRLGEK